MHTYYIRYLIAFTLYVILYLHGAADSGNPLEEMRIKNSIIGNGYGIMTMDGIDTESGRTIFWGQKASSDHAWHAEALHPVLYEYATNRFSDLIPSEEIMKLIPADGVRRVIEIAADRTMGRIVLDYVKNLALGQGAITELLIYDLKNKHVVLRSTDLHYHTNLSMSPDGRHLAFCSQPPDWIMMGMNYDKPCGQIDVMDVENAKITTVADAISGGRSMQDRLYWSPDSKSVVFTQPKIAGKVRTKTLIKWDVERNKKSEFPLTDDRRYVDGLKILSDQRLLVFTNKEIFTLDKDFKFDKTHYTGFGLNGFQPSGTTVRFNDRGTAPGPGFGQPREIKID